jgi:hypothetical protein
MSDPLEYQMEVESEIIREHNRDYTHTVNITIEQMHLILHSLREEAKELESKVHGAFDQKDRHPLLLRLYHLNAMRANLDKVLKEQESVLDPLLVWAMEQVSMDESMGKDENKQDTI